MFVSSADVVPDEPGTPAESDESGAVVLDTSGPVLPGIPGSTLALTSGLPVVVGPDDVLLPDEVLLSDDVGLLALPEDVLPAAPVSDGVVFPDALALAEPVALGSLTVVDVPVSVESSTSQLPADSAGTGNSSGTSSAGTVSGEGPGGGAVTLATGVVAASGWIVVCMGVATTG